MNFHINNRVQETLSLYIMYAAKIMLIALIIHHDFKVRKLGWPQPTINCDREVNAHYIAKSFPLVLTNVRATLPAMMLILVVGLLLAGMTDHPVGQRLVISLVSAG